MEHQLFDPQTSTFLIPRRDGSTVHVQMRSVYTALGRVQEIATVNAQKAPELLATFNMAYLDVIEVQKQLELLEHDAEQVANLRKSVVLLDLVPKYMQERGISTSRSPLGSEDLRKAMLDRDEEYLACLDRVAHIQAVQKLVDGQKEGLEMAFTSVKKILGGETNWQGLNQNRNLSAGAPSGPLYPPVPSTPAEAPRSSNTPSSNLRSRFGGAKVT